MKFIGVEYVRNARLKAAFLVGLPAAVALGAVGGQLSAAVGTIAATASSLGVTFLIAQLGRDQGRLKQMNLYSLWGGKPSMAKLRHRDSSLNPHTKQRYFECLAQLVPDLRRPSIEEENRDPAAADLVYESCGDFLIGRTRDKEHFPLVFAENVNYGFRRNLWGMKSAGIWVCVLTLLGLGGLAGARYWRVGMTPTAALWTAFVFAGLMLVLWLSLITPAWVKIAADAYAERLLAVWKSCKGFSSL